MSIHRQPIADRIDGVLDLAQRHTADFRSPAACLARDRYLTDHPTAIVVLKCMDGRIDIPVVTGTPYGIIQPFRNLGGIFDLGWPHLGEVMANLCTEDGHCRPSGADFNHLSFLARG